LAMIRGQPLAKFRGRSKGKDLIHKSESWH
jgi:hypothetical protein